MEGIQEQIVDITDLVRTQFSITNVEASAPQVVGSLPPLEEFPAPVCNQVHQEQIVAGETTQYIVEILVVQEQVIFQKIPQAPQVVGSLPLSEDLAAQEQIVATVQPQAIVQDIPQLPVVEWRPSKCFHRSTVPLPV